MFAGVGGKQHDRALESPVVPYLLQRYVFLEALITMLFPQTPGHLAEEILRTDGIGGDAWMPPSAASALVKVTTAPFLVL